MERQNEPLAQQKPWEEMTEEERQVVRESWKHTLPEKFDVFCIGDMSLKSTLEVPGNVYISENVFCSNSSFPTVNVKDNFFVNGNIESGDITVGSNFIVEGEVDTLDITVGESFIVGSDASFGILTVHGDCIIDGKVDSYEINVDGLFDCYDVDPNEYEIFSTDFVCRRFEKNK